jgi:hypothetical protein
MTGEEDAVAGCYRAGTTPASKEFGSDFPRNPIVQSSGHFGRCLTGRKSPVILKNAKIQYLLKILWKLLFAVVRFSHCRKDLPPHFSNPPAHPSDAMKFLLKVAVLAAAAKFVLHTPQGNPIPSRPVERLNRPIDRVGDMTIRDIGHHVDTVFARFEATLRAMLS